MNDKAPTWIRHFRVAATTRARSTNEGADAWHWAIVVLGVLSLAIYCVIGFYSKEFSFESQQADRPLLLVLSLFVANFIAYLSAQWTAIRSQSRHLTVTIICFAVAYRLVMVASVPIQEIDIYRYVWDGVVSTKGVSPFDYSPHEVLAADSTLPLSNDLLKLVEARDSSPAIRTLLSRIHFGELPTVYPPASQAVFAIAAWTTPDSVSESTRLLVMKLWLLLFDVGTIIVLVAFFRFLKLHSGWLVSYSWCPLVLKEFSNSGHLDSIAVFLCTLTVYLTMTSLFRCDHLVEHRVRPSLSRLLLASVLLALAIGAKLYPIVLVPLFAGSALRRLGWTQTLFVALVWCATTTFVLYPMFGHDSTAILATAPNTPVNPMEDQFEDPSTQTPAPNSGDRQAGLRSFLSHWMMNDFIFLNISENLTPDSVRGENVRPWFVWVPNAIPERVANVASATFGIEPSRIAFVVARTVTGVMFSILACYWAYLASQQDDPQRWCELIFLTLAWFWLLLPTLNPWYWIWSLPFVATAKNRVWLSMSGLLFIYYLRFYFEGRWPAEAVVSFLPYRGSAFFDYVVVWVEYLPFMICLVAGYVIRVQSIKQD